MKKLTYNTSCVFINPTFTMQINPSLEIQAEMQVICALGNKGWSYDDIDVIDISEIRYSGFVIYEMDKVNAFIKHHKEIGIDIWRTVGDAAEKMVREYTVTEFIETYTPLKQAR